MAASTMSANHNARSFNHTTTGSLSHDTTATSHMSSLGLMRSMNSILNNANDNNNNNTISSNDTIQLPASTATTDGNEMLHSATNFSLNDSPLVVPYSRIEHESDNKHSSGNTHNADNKQITATPITHNKIQRSPPLMYEPLSSPAFRSTANTLHNTTTSAQQSISLNRSPTNMRRSPRVNPNSFFNSPVNTPSISSILNNNSSIYYSLGTPSLSFALSSPQLQASTIMNSTISGSGSNNYDSAAAQQQSHTSLFNLPPRRSPRMTGEKSNLFQSSQSPLINNKYTSSIYDSKNVFKSPSFAYAQVTLPPLHSSHSNTTNLLSVQPSTNTTPNTSPNISANQIKRSPKLNSELLIDSNSPNIPVQHIEPHQPHHIQSYDETDDTVMNDDIIDDMDDESNAITSPTVLQSMSEQQHIKLRPHHPKRQKIQQNKQVYSPARNELSTINQQLAGAGSSCHQCKSRRSIDYLVFCRNMFPKNKNINLKQNKLCRKKYCETCLLKFYGERPPHDRQNPQLTGWLCLSCRGICCCAACRRAKTRTPDEIDNNYSYTYQPHDQYNNTPIQSINNNTTTIDNTINHDSDVTEKLDLSTVKPANLVAYGIVHFTDWFRQHPADHTSTDNIDVNERIKEYMSYVQSNQPS